MEEFFFEIQKNKENIRIDVYLSEEIDDLSRNGIQKLIQDGFVEVNGKQIKSNYKLKSNDIVKIKIPEPVEINVEPENIPLSIMHEDEHVIVVDKPKGMVVHPAAGHYTGTLVNGLLYHFYGKLSGINGVLRPGIVHRIDKDTSGILVVAKNNEAHQNLSLQLARHSMTRVYNAVVYNGIKNDSGTVDKPIGRHPIDRKKMSVNLKNGKHAVTHYNVLERFGKYTFIEAKLETGRTHQIRVHMAYIGHPLLGDYVYGNRDDPFKLEGQALHARTLGFAHPSTGKYLLFESPLPDYFLKLLERLRR